MNYRQEKLDSESGSTAGSAGGDSPDYERRSASSIDLRQGDDTIEPPPIRRNASDVTIGWTPDLASQSSFLPLQPLGSPPISPNSASFPKRQSLSSSSPSLSPSQSHTVLPRSSPYDYQPPGGQSTPPIYPSYQPAAKPKTPMDQPAPPNAAPPAPPQSYFPYQPTAAYEPGLPMGDPARIASPVDVKTPPAPVPAPLPAQTFDYKPYSSMTGIRDATTADTSARDPSVRSPYPVAAFGFGGKLLTSFPSTTTHGFYGSGGASVKIQDLDQLVPQPLLEDFPGPLFAPKANPTKAKKDVIEWLVGRLTEAEKEVTFHRSTGQETKRQTAEDLSLLLQILKIMIEHDGKLAGLCASPISFPSKAQN